MKRTRLVAIVAATVALLVVGTGVALAYFQLYGEHDTSATTARQLAPIVSSSSSLDQLYPGADGRISVTVKNPNVYPITVSKIDAHSVATKSGCPAFALESTGFTQAQAAVKIPASASHTYALTVKLNSWADGHCAAQHFDVKIRVYAGSTT